MNGIEQGAEAVRQMFGHKTNKRGHRLFTKEAESAAVSFAVRRLERGESAAQIATELGLKGGTLQRWLQRHRRGAGGQGGSRFHEVEVTPKQGRHVVVHGQFGVRVEGLSLDETAELLRKLSCSA
jgi:transposase-like protein